MSKRTFFTTLTPLPAGITRETVMETLHAHTEMIDLNPLVEERHTIKPPSEATAEEYHCVWYSLTDRVVYFPGVSGQVSYNACFHDLTNGLQTHVYAPMGLNIKGKWTLGGSLPGESIAPVELGLGAPIHGLYLREDVDMKCNIMMTSFVKKTLKKAHAHLVDRLLIKAQIEDAAANNRRINERTLSGQNHYSSSQSSTQFSPGSGSENGDNRSMDDTYHQRHYSGTQQSPSLAFRAPNSPDSSDPSDSLYPRPLSMRSSAASHNGSLNSGSVNGQGRYSQQDTPVQRVSWQNLTESNTPAQSRRGSPSPQHAEVAFGQQPRPQPNMQRSFHAELESNELLPKTTYRPQPRLSAAELE